jgi:hypothetical protein
VSAFRQVYWLMQNQPTQKHDCNHIWQTAHSHILSTSCAVVPPGYFTSSGTGAAAQLRPCGAGSYAAGWVPTRTRCISCGTNIGTNPQDPNEHQDTPALIATSSASCSESHQLSWVDFTTAGACDHRSGAVCNTQDSQHCHTGYGSSLLPA